MTSIFKTGSDTLYFEYDAAGRTSLFAPETPSSTVNQLSFDYDADGSLCYAESYDGSSTTPNYFFYDTTSANLELLARQRSGDFYFKFLHGPSRVPGIGSVIEHGRGPSEILTPHMDHRGTVFNWTNIAGTPMSPFYFHEAFGTMSSFGGSIPIDKPFDMNYQSNWLLLETLADGSQLYLTPSGRIYHTGLGRFLSRDPIGYRGGINLYLYVGNRPLLYLDPFGKERQANMWDHLKSEVYSDKKWKGTGKPKRTKGELRNLWVSINKRLSKLNLLKGVKEGRARVIHRQLTSDKPQLYFDTQKTIQEKVYGDYVIKYTDHPDGSFSGSVDKKKFKGYRPLGDPCNIIIYIGHTNWGFYEGFFCREMPKGQDGKTMPGATIGLVMCEPEKFEPNLEKVGYHILPSGVTGSLYDPDSGGEGLPDILDEISERVDQATARAKELLKPKGACCGKEVRVYILKGMRKTRFKPWWLLKGWPKGFREFKFPKPALPRRR